MVRVANDRSERFADAAMGHRRRPILAGLADEEQDGQGDDDGRDAEHDDRTTPAEVGHQPRASDGDDHGTQVPAGNVSGDREPAAVLRELLRQEAVADRMLKLLQRQKVLVRVDVLLFHDEALKRLKAEVAGLKASAGAGARIDVATFKERFGVTRKFAIPLLEYLDRERVTRRMGETRVVL